jgi:hypothetical protein
VRVAYELSVVNYEPEARRYLLLSNAAVPSGRQCRHEELRSAVIFAVRLGTAYTLTRTAFLFAVDLIR